MTDPIATSSTRDRVGRWVLGLMATVGIVFGVLALLGIPSMDSRLERIIIALLLILNGVAVLRVALARDRAT